MIQQISIARQTPKGVAPWMQLARVATVSVRSARHARIRAAPAPRHVREALARPHTAHQNQAAHIALPLLTRHGTEQQLEVRRGGRDEMVHVDGQNAIELYSSLRHDCQNKLRMRIWCVSAY
jgi:hypothetical protein